MKMACRWCITILLGISFVIGFGIIPGERLTYGLRLYAVNMMNRKSLNVNAWWMGARNTLIFSVSWFVPIHHKRRKVEQGFFYFLWKNPIESSLNLFVKCMAKSDSILPRFHAFRSVFHRGWLSHIRLHEPQKYDSCLPRIQLFTWFNWCLYNGLYIFPWIKP